MQRVVDPEYIVRRCIEHLLFDRARRNAVIGGGDIASVRKLGQVLCDLKVVFTVIEEGQEFNGQLRILAGLGDGEALTDAADGGVFALCILRRRRREEADVFRA